MEGWELVETSSAGDIAHLLPDFKIYIPVDLAFGGSDLQVKVSQALKIEWPTGLFAQSFPDLSKLAASISSVTLEDLQKHISDLRASGSQTVDVFGANIPSDLLRTWGLFVLIAVQFYYYIHLKQFHKTFGSERLNPSFAWVACYSDRTARYAYISSVIFVPIATAAYLSLTHLDFSTNKTQAILGIVAALAALNVALLTWRETTLSKTI